jgi:hypothetical protein
MGVRHESLTPIAGRIIHDFIFGVLGACRQAPYKFEKIVWGRLCMETPYSEHIIHW